MKTARRLWFLLWMGIGVAADLYAVDRLPFSTEGKDMTVPAVVCGLAWGALVARTLWLPPGGRRGGD